MPQLTTEDAKRYPYLYSYLKDAYPKVAKDDRVMRAYLRWSAFTDRDDAEKAFRYGSRPKVLFSEDFPFGCHYPGDRARPPPGAGYPIGLLSGKTYSKDVVMIYSGLAEFANHSYLYISERSKESTPGDLTIVKFFEVVLTHELVHWSYYENDVDEHDKYKSLKRLPDGYDTDEFGTQHFEEEAYGQQFRKIDLHLFCLEQETDPPRIGTALDMINGKLQVTAVLSWSAADNAGVQEGDIILAADEKPVKDEADFDNVHKTKKAGDKMKLKVKRGQKELDLEIEFAPDKGAVARARYNFP